VGLTHERGAFVRGPSSSGQLPVSPVVFDPSLLVRLSHANLVSGAQVAAQTCSACHGDAGVPQDPQYPELADQSAPALYKELRDYKVGARVSPFMAPMVKNLTDQQMIDVAAYFSSDHAFGALGRRWELPDPETARLVNSGDPVRELPACDACHASGAGGPMETPVLYGQGQAYLVGQLQAFASGARRNDEYGRMRAVARKLNADEQARLAAYYQGLGPTAR
jgi:cytochrome c553